MRWLKRRNRGKPRRLMPRRCTTRKSGSANLMPSCQSGRTRTSRTFSLEAMRTTFDCCRTVRQRRNCASCLSAYGRTLIHPKDPNETVAPPSIPGGTLGKLVESILRYPSGFRLVHLPTMRRCGKALLRPMTETPAERCALP